MPETILPHSGNPRPSGGSPRQYHLRPGAPQTRELAKTIGIGEQVELSELDVRTIRAFVLRRDADDSLRPAEGILASMLVGLAGWAIIGLIAASVYLDRIP